MTSHQPDLTTAISRLTAAAGAGDTTAQAALDALTTAAKPYTDDPKKPERDGKAAGLAEARKRFGKPA